MYLKATPKRARAKNLAPDLVYPVFISSSNPIRHSSFFAIKSCKTLQVSKQSCLVGRLSPKFCWYHGEFFADGKFKGIFKGGIHKDPRYFYSPKNPPWQ